jgi:hypothetical protein
MLSPKVRKPLSGGKEEEMTDELKALLGTDEFYVQMEKEHTEYLKKEARGQRQFWILIASIFAVAVIFFTSLSLPDKVLFLGCAFLAHVFFN